MGAHQPRSRRAAALLTAVLAAVLAGCGSTQLDSAKAERTIANLVTSKLRVAVRSVRCPAHVKLHQGMVTVCQATLRTGETEPFTVTQTNAKGNVQIAPMNLLAAAVERNIVTRLAQRRIRATAICPQHVPVRVGATFTCTATDVKGANLTITATILDVVGSYRLHAG